jgi:glycerol-3-phosphate dehydrogenase
MTPIIDILVVGGGINGVGIARDAAGRGLSVMLCEKDDLASHTSSASTKLIHGGLRYLEYYQFGMVRKALQEREVLLRAAPHIITPLHFVMPHAPLLRPAWLIRLGLFLYDHLNWHQSLPRSRAVRLNSHVAGEALRSEFSKGFIYSDAWVDDARLVVLNAMSAQELGATILTRTELISAQPELDIWRAELRTANQQTLSVRARCIVNATGPWASSFLRDQLHVSDSSHPLKWVKGSHIVVPKLVDHDYAYIFQNQDQRIIFAIPFLGRFTLIGTTDVAYQGDLNAVEITGDEIDYLCTAANRYFKKPITPKDVVWTYAGVRPLLANDDAANLSALTRDYHLEFVKTPAPILSVFGGKITTYRRLAEEALPMLQPVFDELKLSWTATLPLPGGDIPDFNHFYQAFRRDYAWLPETLARRFAHSYGTRVERLLAGCASLADLGEELSPGLYEQEARYLVRHEWAQHADDILWRRTKLGLSATPTSVKRLEQWLVE